MTEDRYEYAAECQFRDGTTLLDGQRFTSFEEADYGAATIRAQHPPRREPEPGELRRIKVVRRRVGEWEPADD